MKNLEYMKVASMNYQEYCAYLQDKYGVPKYDYMTKSFNKNPKVSRTKEGLVVNHMDEDKMIMLSQKEFAQLFPFEWQTKEHLVYCDYLEHLFLHILICENPSPEREPSVDVGIGGVINFIVPELNDVYSGWQTKEAWRKACHDKIIEDIGVYKTLLFRFIMWYKENGGKDRNFLFTSFNEKFGLWSKEKNKELFFNIYMMWDTEPL